MREFLVLQDPARDQGLFAGLGLVAGDGFERFY